VASRRAGTVFAVAMPPATSFRYTRGIPADRTLSSLRLPDPAGDVAATVVTVHGTWPQDDDEAAIRRWQGLMQGLKARAAAGEMLAAHGSMGNVIRHVGAPLVHLHLHDVTANGDHREAGTGGMDFEFHPSSVTPEGIIRSLAFLQGRIRALGVHRPNG